MRMIPVGEHWQHQLWCLMRWVQWPRDPVKNCWIWQGTTVNGTGTYGRFYYEGRRTMAHRSSWELWNNQKIPAGQVMRHLCHNPQCVNPRHLEPGSQKQNMEDMRRANRQGYRSKLTEAQKKRIRVSGGTLRQLADEYGVSVTTIHRVKK